MSSIKDLLDFLEPHCQTDPARLALMREVLDVNSPLMSQIEISGNAHTFSVNLLSKLAPHRSARDALIDALKDRYGSDYERDFEQLRLVLHDWAERGAASAELTAARRLAIVILAAPDDALAARLNDQLPQHGFDVLRANELSFADRVIAVDHADTSQARANCKPIIYLWHTADAAPHAEALDLRTATDLKPLIAALRKPTERLGRLFGAPPLPDHYIRRQEPLDAVVHSLTDERTNVAAICAVHGMPGIGKSVLARAALDSCAVRRAFPDGLFYLNVSDRNYVAAQKNLAQRLGLPIDNFTDRIEDNRALLADLIEEKRLRLLILLDNVRDAKAVEAFQNLRGCKVLFTTRKETIARALQAALTSLSVLSDAEGAQLILKFLGFTDSPSDQRADSADVQNLAMELSRTLRGHPLAISLAAARWQRKGIAQGKQLLDEYAVLLQDVPAGDPLDVFEPDEDLDQELGEATEALKPNLERIFQLSYDELSDDNKRRFRELGIFAVESRFDAQAAAAIWQDDDPQVAQSKLETFTRLALLSRTDDGRFTQHSLLRAYAFKKLREPSGGFNGARRRHFEYFFERRKAQRVDRVLLSAELPNILLAFRFGIDHDEDAVIDWVMKLAKPMRGINRAERRAILELGLEAARRAQNRDAEAFCLHALCDVARDPAERQALTEAFRAAVRGSCNVRILQMSALLESRLGNVTEARRLFERAVQADPSDAPSWQAYALFEREQGDVAKARRLFERAVQADPQHAPAWQAYALFEREQGDVAKARRLFERAVQADPSDAPAWQAYALFERDQRNYSEAERLLREGLRRVSDSKGKGLLHSTLGSLLAGGRKLQEAEKHFRTALRYNSGDPLTHYHFAVRVLLSTNRKDEACQHLCRAKALRPKKQRDRKLIEDAIERSGCRCAEQSQG